MKIRGQQLVEKQNGASESGIGCLPVEVLSDIFLQSVPADTFAVWASSSVAPISLTGTCRRWREIAVNMPGLWCRLFVKGRSDREEWEKAAFWYALWLTRSRERPLSLAILCLPHGTADVRSLLQPYTNQVSSLEIIFDFNSLAPELLFQDLPALRELALYWPRCTSHYDMDIPWTISRFPSTLRNLTLRGILADPSRWMSTSNVCAHLINIEMTVNQPHEFHRLLHLCPNISSANISLNLRVTIIQPLEPVMHTNLRSLSFTCSGRGLSYMFNVLTVPNLRTLETRYSWWPHKEFMAFLARSSCPMERLIFSAGGAGMTDENRAEYISLVPSLEIVFDPRGLLIRW
jgi:hypothetical protein